MSATSCAVNQFQLGVSAQGKPLVAHTFEPRIIRKKVLFLAGVHGDEIESVWALESLLSSFIGSHYPFQHVMLLAVPQVNPDGTASGTRLNGNGVDLNRNLPTLDWTKEVLNPRYPPGSEPCSEVENKILVALIEKFNPDAILSLHSFKDYQVNANGPREALNWAEALSKVCGYRVTENIGYPTPGSLGTYAGVERNIPTITLEIERGLPKEKVLEIHLPVLNQALFYWDQK